VKIIVRFIQKRSTIFGICFYQQNQTLDDYLPESAAALEKYYDSVKKGKEELEAKLNKAKHLREKISQLKSTKDFLSQKDLSQLNIEMATQTSAIHNSSVTESEIRMLEEKLAKLKTSGTVISPIGKIQIRNRIEAIQKSIANAAKVQEKISKAETDSEFCSETEIEKLQKEFDSVQRVLKKLQPFNTGKVLILLLSGYKNTF
jgi:cob(I)alamin adenosyltransferase